MAASDAAAAGRGSLALGLLVPALAVAAAVAWRIPLPEWWWPWAASGAVLWTALLIGGLAPAAARAGLWAIGLVLAIVAPLSLSDALWPCSTACQGGGHYQRLAGVRIEWLAMAAGAWWAMIARIDAVRGDPAHPVGSLARATTWGLAGVSLYHLWVAAGLGLACPHCLAVHTIVLAGALLSLRDGYPWLARLGAVLLCFLLLHFVHHPGLVRDLPGAAAAAAELPPAERAELERIDANRVRSAGGDPAWQLDLVIDLHCPACARLHPRLVRLAPPPGGGLRVATRLLARPSQAQARELARRAVAAAAIDAGSFQRFLAVAMGAADGIGWGELKDRVGEVADAERIEALAAERGALIDRLLDADARIAAEAGGGTPAAILRDPSGKIAGRWTGEIDPAVIQAVMATAAPR